MEWRDFDIAEYRRAIRYLHVITDVRIERNGARLQTRLILDNGAGECSYWECLADAFGADPANWLGRQISVFLTTDHEGNPDGWIEPFEPVSLESFFSSTRN